MSKFFDSKDRTGEFDSADIQQASAIAGICYIPLLFFLPLVATQGSRYGKFHANQSLLVLIAIVAVSICDRIIDVLLGILSATPVVGAIFGILSNLISLAVAILILTLIIVGMVNGFQGKAKEIPVIGKYKIIG